MEQKNVRRGAREGRFPWFGVGFVIFAAAVAGAVFTGLPAKVGRNLKEILGDPKPQEASVDDTMALQVEERLRAEYEDKLKKELAALKASQKTADPANPPTPQPAPEMPRDPVMDVRNLRSGIPFRTEVLFGEGETALAERAMDDSFTASYQLKLRLPKPAISMADLEKGTPELSKILPGFAAMMPTGKISPWYTSLYRNKADRVRKDANELNELLTKHNVYDCNTILHLQSEKGRKVFYMQADMDVVSDGSDGDRLPEMPESIVNSTFYQPFTSYGWAKRGKTPNPMIAGWEKRIEIGTQELNDPKTAPERKKWIQDRIAMLKRGIQDLKARSYLIAGYDPFIVIPINLLTDRTDPFTPKVGDYAVVIHARKIYPCIVGDGGPTFKVGEASLRLAKQINPNSNSYSRPVSDLSVSYVVFPGSRDAKPGPPDYAKWRERCYELMQEIGGFGNGYEYHQWTDLLAKSDEKTPGETPTEND